MSVRSWLLPCATATSTAADSNTPPQSSSFSNSDTSVNSSSSSSTPTSDTSCSTLQSNLSLQSQPSIPSLQTLPTVTDTGNVAVSQLHLASFKLPISHLAVHGPHLYVATAHEINVYDRSTYTHVASINDRDSSSGAVKGIAFLNAQILTSHQDGKIRVWNLTNNQFKKVNTLPTVNDRLRRFLLPKNYVNVRRHKKVLWIQHADAVTGLAVNRNSFYSVSWDRSLKIWQGSDHRCVESVKAAHEDAINAVAVSAAGIVYTGSADRRIRVWSKPAAEKRHILVTTLEKHKSAVNALALNDDGSLLFSGACDRSVLVWEREDGANHMAVIGALRGHKNAILCLIYVSDLLLSGSADRTVRVWRRVGDGSFNCLSVLEGHRKPVKSLVVVSDGLSNGVVSVCSGSLDGEVKAWKLSFSNINGILNN
ncbi:protein JINGUBANG-like [Cucurbita pepo subsp. pepo]|uniref:protein JINGUBANG-like n=1 Tax=Cucurbita pepo subsp. pepo TaxID=3664 RepID=UPI000C9D2696|nr:protein JINGUBANG-like [Cucurbita pepo subsp. pepo]